MNNYNECMQKVLTAIESDLEYVSIEDLIKTSGYSYYHFHRIFKAYTGESLKKYIKRLQLEKALHKMQIDNQNITQLAIEAGFNMSSSFNKAFKMMFDTNPTTYKRKLLSQRENYADIEPIKQINIKPIEVYSIRHRGKYEDANKTWDEMIAFASKHKLFNKNFGAYGITYDNPDITDSQRLRYDICVTKTKNIQLEEESPIQIKYLDGGKYTVFLHKGDPKGLIDVYNSIFGKWLYKNTIVLRDVPVIQKMLGDKSKISLDEYLIEVWVPVE